MSAPIDHLARLNAPIERRFYPRVAPLAPETIPLGRHTSSDAQSSLLNLSENGLLLSTASTLDVNSVHRVSLELSGIPKTVSVYVRTVWTDSSNGLAGVQLLDLSEDDRELLRRWSALQSPEHEVFALSENAAESESEVASDAALADSGSSRGIFDDERTPLTPIQSPAPPHAPASPLYFWGAALAVMCLGTVWASTHNVLGDFKTPKPSSSLSNSIREGDSRNHAAFSRSVLSSMNAPKSSHFRDALPNESDSLPRSSHSEATSNPMATARDTVRQPIPPTNSRTEITGNAVAEKSAIVGSTHLPKPLPAPSPSSGPTPTAKVVSRTPPSSYSSPASTIPPVITSRKTTNPTPALDAREPTPRPFIVELPVSGSNSLVSLPGERIINSPSVTMHVQRSVWLRGGLRFWRRRKKVEVGQLTAHADPQIPSGPRFGSITVQAMVDKQGRITGIRPLYGSIAFLPTVSRALSAWRYQPTYIDNKPVETVARIEVDFHSSSARSYRP